MINIYEKIIILFILLFALSTSLATRFTWVVYNCSPSPLSVVLSGWTSFNNRGSCTPSGGPVQAGGNLNPAGGKLGYSLEFFYIEEPGSACNTLIDTITVNNSQKKIIAWRTISTGIVVRKDGSVFVYTPKSGNPCNQ